MADCFTRRTFLQAASAGLCLPLLSRGGAAMARQPYLQNVLAHRATVLWTTQASGSGTVTITPPDTPSFTVQATMRVYDTAQTQLTAPFYQFQADVTGLDPATEYRYQVEVDGQVLGTDPAEFRFKTAPRGEFSFLAFGDSGAGSPEQESLIQLMAAERGISMVVHLGDMAYPAGTFEEFESAYFGLNAPLMRRLPFFSAPGNHEYLTNSGAPYVAGVVVPEGGVPAVDIGRYYSFNWGFAHFVSLDSNLLATARAADMLAWLDADLASATQRWRIVFLHHTPYPTGFHVGDPLCVAVRQMVNPIIEKHGVQLLLAGHEHGYERTYPLAGGQPAAPGVPSTTYVVSGGGGGALESVGNLPQCALSMQVFHYLRVNVGKDSLAFSAVGLDGSTIDEVTLGSSAGVVLGRVVSKGDYTSAIAPGSLVSISGLNLASRVEGSSSYPLRTELGGTSIHAGGRLLPLMSVAPTEIQAQIPYEAFGPTTLEVSTPYGRAFTNITVSPTAPSLIAVSAGKAAFSGSNPARQGERATLYLTGLGVTRQPIQSGSAPASPAVPVAPVDVWFGNRRITPLSVFAQGMAGIYCVEIEIPNELDDGVYLVRVDAGGASSRPINLDVMRRGTADLRDRARAKVHALAV